MTKAITNPDSRAGDFGVLKIIILVDQGRLVP